MYLKYFLILYAYSSKYDFWIQYLMKVKVTQSYPTLCDPVDRPHGLYRLEY